MSNNQDIIEFPASSYEGERLSVSQKVARFLIAVILTAIMLGVFALIGNAERESLQEHADWYGQMREMGAATL